MSHNFVETLTDAIGLAVNEVEKLFGDKVEVIRTTDGEVQ